MPKLLTEEEKAERKLKREAYRKEHKDVSKAYADEQKIKPHDYTPRPFDPQVGDEICAKIANGMSIIRAAREAGFPGGVTIYRWAWRNEAFAEQLAIAREMQCEHYAQEIIDLSDVPLMAKKAKKLADGSVEVTQFDNVERTRLMMDARKWYAAHVHPRKYGRPDIEITNEIVTTVIVDF
jgi:hypothetical protein